MPDPARVAARLETLWEIRRAPGGGADRPAYSPAEATAMLRVAGLQPGLDAYGNLWALPPSWEGALVSSGSHVDTVPDGGRYDGALGTVLGLELAHDLRAGTAGGARPALLVCAAEEAPRFGAGTLGSRLLAGTLAPESLAELRDRDGVSVTEALAGHRTRLAELPVIEPPLDRIRAHAEIHVAQRRALRQLGVVTRVATPRRVEIEVHGRAGHAGEVSMEDRRDALAAAAEIVLAIEFAARAEPPETVATVGTLTVAPGAVSVIPAHARLVVDARGISAHSVDRLEAVIRSVVAEIASRRGVEATLRQLRGGDPTVLDAGLAAAALEAAHALGIPATETWSGAGHDAQHLSTLTPTLLVFVPLEGGESHTPEEGADEQDIINAARIAEAVLGVTS